MVAVIAVVCALLALVVVVMAAAHDEVYRDVRQIRAALGILDRPLEVELGEVRGGQPSRYGLPASLDASPRAVVLFFHDSCSTCVALATAMRGRLPDGLWLIIEARNDAAAHEFLRMHDLETAHGRERVIIDDGSRIADQLGIRTTPVAFQIHDGAIVEASSVPSPRYLASILPRQVKLQPRAAPPRA